ncbi:hypothetical protein C2S52_012037 [Perilla frutescens var. hirtella]|nr:hypothetical protein C2S52_012037 [Perilla frutescens var. hirtella]
MASLLLPSLATTTPNTTTAATSHRSSSRSVFPKPTHFLAHAKRSHRLHVTSAAAQNQNLNDSSNNADTSTAKVDRRNVLLGLGGLYGAASLIPTPAALADPVLAPNFDKCGVASDAISGEVLEGVNCCLIKEDITDYKLPLIQVPRIRPPAQRASADYVYKYNLAIKKMKELPDTDPRSFMNQANIHCAYCNTAYKQGGADTVPLQIHNSWLFFPFHRWYLYFYEKILGKLIGDPSFALPFWNWDNPKGMTMPPIFNDPNSAIYDPLREQTHLPPAIVDLGLTGSTDPLQLVSNNLTVMYTEMVRGNNTVFDFMGQPYRAGTPVSPGAGASERGSHTSIHIFAGDSTQPNRENMGNFYSAGRDPLFYCHHANVDRMWTLWQRLPSTVIPNKQITDPDYLNANFLLYDENAQLVRVYVKDAISNIRMGYDYERIDLPWLDYRPPRQTAKAKIIRTSTKAPRASFPLKLEKVVRFEVDKTKKGKADESLLLENIVVDTSKFLKFDVFINDEDDAPTELDKAAYAGTYAQVPHKTANRTATSSISLRLTDLYDDMDIEDDDTLVVTLVPRHKGPGVTIGGIKIVANPPKT